MVTAWRIVQSKWAAQAFDGEGARLYGGRWNSQGHAAIYLASSRALAALETLVHIEAEFCKNTFARFPVSFDESYVTKRSKPDLATDWNSTMTSPKNQAFGNSWLLSMSSPLLQIPSAIIPEELNYILNPRHPDFEKISIGPSEAFAFDPRLLN